MAKTIAEDDTHDAQPDDDTLANAILAELPDTDTPDTPIRRADVLHRTLETLELELAVICEQRLAYRRRMEELSKNKEAKVNHVLYVRFERLYESVRKKLDKLEAESDKVQGDLNKLRLLVMEMGD